MSSLLKSKNRKGDIPTTVLVIGVFAVCTLTLLNFYVTGIGDAEIFKGVSLVKEVSKFSGDIKFYHSLGKEALELSKKSVVVSDSDIVIDAVKSGESYNIAGNLSRKDYLFFNERRIVYVEYDFTP